ncbi:MAG: ADP-glyceromanno-heptose 6-epimerase [Lentimicrobium sp.]|nr:ADP-glyceromanno-heptose 6-epimerase [Lentimicrobium sp.]
MIIVTGAAGFIGSCLVGRLLENGIGKIIAVDDFSKTYKSGNLLSKNISGFVERAVFFDWLENNFKDVEFIFHIGARTDTAEFNMEVFEELNISYSQKVWQACTEFNIPLIYASSAATYGMGEFGFYDNHDFVEKFKPLNPYGISKNEFDKWALNQAETPPFWAGMKFFNVYGPNEYHKNRMASVIFHAFKQIKETGQVKLFKSHHPDFKDGEQLRDFIYVKDVVSVLLFMKERRPDSGLYNLGTGKARTFIDLAMATFEAAGIKPKINFVDTPEDIRDKYQYFTEAKMVKLLETGYNQGFYSLEEGVNDYIVNYLMPNSWL